MRRLLRFLSRDFLGFSDFTSSGNAGWAANRSLNFLFTVRSGTTRAQQRIMAKLFSARSGIDVFPLKPDGPLGRATNHGGQKNGEPRKDPRRGFSSLPTRRFHPPKNPETGPGFVLGSAGCFDLSVARGSAAVRGVRPRRGRA